MPEAPWINRCTHGTVVFTDQKSEGLASFMSKFESEKDCSTSDADTTVPAKGLVPIKQRLLDSYVDIDSLVGLESGDSQSQHLLDEEDCCHLTIDDNFKEHPCSHECPYR
jgi:hypothetical protein